MSLEMSQDTQPYSNTTKTDQIGLIVQTCLNFKTGQNVQTSFNVQTGLNF